MNILLLYVPYICIFFSDFKELILERCDLITTKALMRSKKFEYIKIGSHMNKGWRRFCINTEKLSMNFDSLQNIIWNRSAKINSLCIDASDGEIIERIPGLNTRFALLLLFYFNQ